MPELPEVETTKRGIEPYVLHKRVKAVHIYDRRLRWPVETRLPEYIHGKTVRYLQRRGKYLVFGFDNGSLLLHLGMSGSLRITSPKTPRKKHDHLEIVFTPNCALRLHDPRRFGAAIWTGQDWHQHKLIKNLGPEPLSEAFNGEYLWQKSRNKTVAIKNFIMNSHIVVGVGNIYANESLYLAGIHPKRQAGKIARQRYDKLATAIKETLDQAITQGGTTLKDFASPDGNPGYFALQLNVYGRENLPCPRCQHPIKHTVIGQRATYYCGHCQH